MNFIAKLAAYVANHRPDLFKKASMEFLLSQSPSASSAFNSYLRAQERAARDAASFPALHASQPAMYYMNQQLQSGGSPDLAAAQPHRHRRHRHHS